jgi:hypothetical protein
MDLEKLRARFAVKWKNDPETGCWLWIASVAGLGYGQIKIPGQRRQIYAHRLSYLLHVGEIPEGLVICHRCDVPRCVNPAHLFIGTGADNQQDMTAKGRGTGGRKMPVHSGIKNSQARLTERNVREIRKLIKLGLSHRKIGQLFGVTGAQIGHIAHGRAWSYLE